MTEDEIKGLTMGDKVYVRAEVFYVDSKGRECQVRIYGADRDYWGGYVKAEDVYRALPGKAEGAVKDVACRLFRKGDWVRIVKHQGRKFNAAPPAFQLGKTYRVSEDENTEHCYVMLQSCDLHYAHPVAFLELVTPVEEWMPYHIKKAAEFDAWFICNRNNDVIFHFNPDPCNLMMDMAEIEKLAREECDYLNERFRDLIGKSAAEAECERLNAEWQAKVCRSDEGKEGE